MELDLRHIPPGDVIYTQDGDEIGKVKEIRHDYIHVDAPMQPDYWLPAGLVASFADGRITMSFPKSELGKHKADVPAEEEQLDRDQRLRRGDLAGNLGHETGPETSSELYTPDDRELHGR